MIILTIVNSLIALFMLLFTIAIYKISRRQHKLHYEQGIKLFPHPISKTVRIGKELEFMLVVYIINPSLIPVLITDIEIRVITKEGKDELVEKAMYPITQWHKFTIENKLPNIRPEGLYITARPWGIRGCDIAILSQKCYPFDLKYINGKVKTMFRYKIYETGEEKEINTDWIDL
jgi:hypothetical protein